MKPKLKLARLFPILFFVFTSCGTYQIMRYDRTEIDKVRANFSDYHVYIIDSTHTYRVEKDSLAPTGIVGKLVEITDQPQIEEIKNPNTPQLLRKHKHDLDLYTKIIVKDNPKNVILKRTEVTKVVRIIAGKSKGGVGKYIEIVFVVALGSAVLYGVVASFHGLL